jgi:4-hydroxybenzoate polyprenyltransferase
LLFLPCAYSILLFGDKGLASFALLLLFFVGSVLARSAGSIINDIFDKDFDAKVARTKMRPLAEGSISLPAACIILFIISLLALVVLLCLPRLSIQIALFSVILVVCYPLVKRFSYFPQLFLGFTFNVGVLVAAGAIFGNLPLESLILYAGCIFWTLGYDTVYGMMDIADDKKIGVKSMAILLEGKNFIKWIMLFYSIFILGVFSSALSFSGSKVSYLLIFIWLLTIASLKQLDIKSMSSLSSHFDSAAIIGAIISVILYYC